MVNTLEQLINRRQSCRGFIDREVERDKLEKIANLARLTPSACNSQPWKMYFVTNKSVLSGVAESLQDDGMNKFVSQAPCLIVITEKDAVLKPGSEKKFNNNKFVEYDIGELVAYITLIATDLGLDTSIIGWVNQDKLKKALNLEENENSSIVIALGYSDVPLREKKRKELNQIVEFI